MSPEAVVGLMKRTMYVTLLVSAPLLGSGLVIGVLVSIFQAVTQIREMTLAFVPKIVGVLLFLALFASWMVGIMLDYTSALLRQLQTIGP